MQVDGGRDGAAASTGLRRRRGRALLADIRHQVGQQPRASLTLSPQPGQRLGDLLGGGIRFIEEAVDSLIQGPDDLAGGPVTARIEVQVDQRGGERGVRVAVDRRTGSRRRSC